MRTFSKIKYTFIFATIIGLASCDDTDEITQVDFNATITEEITVTLTQDNPSLSESMVVNIADVTQFTDEIGDIESIVINQASYKIKNYIGQPNGSGTITASAASESFGPFQHNFETDSQNGTVFNFQDTNKLNNVANALTANGQITVQFSGTQTPAQDATFDIEISLQVDVVAEAL